MSNLMTITYENEVGFIDKPESKFQVQKSKSLVKTYNLKGEVNFVNCHCFEVGQIYLKK